VSKTKTFLTAIWVIQLEVEGAWFTPIIHTNTQSRNKALLDTSSVFLKFIKIIYVKFWKMWCLFIELCAEERRYEHFSTDLWQLEVCVWFGHSRRPQIDLSL